MLIRRLHERIGNPRLLHVGTSATLVSGGNREERRAGAARAASQLFGVEVKPENVADEALRRIIYVPAPADQSALRLAVEAPLPPKTLDGIRHDPLAAWIEETFGIEEEGGRLVRRRPITFEEGAHKLSQDSGLPEGTCREKLQALLSLGNELLNDEGDPVFAFRLHQFLAGGGAVYAGLRPLAERNITLEGQQYGPDGESRLYPLAFCRECGQEYYISSLQKSDGGQMLLPGEPFLDDPEDDDSGASGYFLLDEEGVWTEDRATTDLPDHWYETRKSGQRVKPDYAKHLPKRLRVGATGAVASLEETAVEGWFQPKTFLLCLRCGIAYERAERNDFRKLTRLSHTGRSTATTLVTTSTAVHLRHDPEVPEQARKLLSFTDNRQDASLQAGHLNDFVQVALVRAALFRALTDAGELDHATAAPALFQALDLPQHLYAREPADYGPGKDRNESVFRQLLEYRLYEDLRRGWRIIQPNLEQCGLLHMDFQGLPEYCREDRPWAGHRLLAEATPGTRERVVRAFLLHVLREKGLDARPLQPEAQLELRKRVEQAVREPWAFEEGDRLVSNCYFLLPGQAAAKDQRERSLGATSKVGRYLRARATWGIGQDVSTGDYERLVLALTEALRGQFIMIGATPSGGRGIQVLANCLRWKIGDGTPPPPDPITTRWGRTPEMEQRERRANEFFAELYRETAQHLAGVEGREHTAMVPADIRQEREARFREGKLTALYCSPTMELGIDIFDLNVVHLRNVPPTPANYAQRSGRAGRGGQPALVATFCGEGSPHDQYFFRRRPDMVSGSVAPARLDLGNAELVRAHVHSVWLARTGVGLGRSVAEVLDLDQPGYPLLAEHQERLGLSQESRADVLDTCRNVLAACGSDITSALWSTEDWLERAIDGAPGAFDRAFDRGRELYRAAVQHRDEARRIIDSHRAGRREKAEAARREAEAKREVDLLLNQSDVWAESDFYPYRYLAGEAFIPGYNFPRLPVSALVRHEQAQHNIDRPRFLAISEFGPRNILYHEGRKYRVVRCLLPPGGIDQRLTVAKLCEACGYFHEGQGAHVDQCDHCGAPLDAERSEYINALLEMSTVYGQQVERITCDEEERVRQGFHITTHYRFAQGSHGQTLVEDLHATGSDGEPLLELRHAPQATLWRVNHRWRKARQPGFTMDARTGYWERRPGEVTADRDIEGPNTRTGIRLFVRDTRNIVLVQPRAQSQHTTGADREGFLASLGYALQRGMQELYQVEERELAVERIGDDAMRQLLYWEQSEGGTGVWPRLMEDPTALAQVAGEALQICHFDPTTGDDLPDACSRACYRCLLSYSNQRDHAILDRHLVRGFLLALAGSAATRRVAQRSCEEQYAWLAERLDRRSDLERALLAYLFESGHRLPDRAQYRPEPNVYAEADFYYERPGIPGVAVFCDGPDHDRPQRKAHDDAERANLEDLGYRVIVIRYDQDLAAQVYRHMEVFGPGAS
jgi:hypothetical protein